MSLALSLEARIWVELLFGKAFGPAWLALALVAPTMVLTYIAHLTSTALILIGRGWTVTLVNVVTLAFNAVLALLIIRPTQAWLGVPGAGGAGVAISLLAAELMTAIWLLVVLGRDVVDARLLRTLLGLVAACAITGLAHWVSAPLGRWRLLTDGVTYLGAILLTGALRPREAYDFLRASRRMGSEAT